MKREIVAVAACAVLAAIASSAPMRAQAPAAAPTFSKDVAPILYKNCTNCHRAGEIGPMALVTYNDARPWAKSIATRVTNGTMPPWHADPAHGEFLNDRRLSDADRDTIVKWASGGAPEGNKTDLPALPKFADGWQMGQPDVVFAMQEDYPIPAEGTLDYKWFEVPTNLTEDKWVQAIEIRPGARSNVHHVIAYMRTPQPAQPAQPAAAPAAGAAQGPRPTPPFTMAPGMGRPPTAPKEDRAPVENDRPPTARPGAWLGGFAPGQAVRVYQPGTALKIPAGAVLMLQMHYTASGKAAADRTRIGIKYASAPPKTEVRVVALANQNFVLKAGAPDTRVDAEVTLNQDMTLWSVLPHTHVRGKKWEVTAIYPDGRSEVILNVPKYDFNWQTDYVFKQPLQLPKGTKLHTAAWYDNSPAYKPNPDPKKDVYWGDQTWEEMQFTAFTISFAPAETKTSAGQQ
jgi:hypothetical protein